MTVIAKVALISLVQWLAVLGLSANPFIQTIWGHGVYQNGGGSAIESIAVDSAGNIYAAGSLGGTSPSIIGGIPLTPSGTYCGLLLKYSSTGSLLWATCSKEEERGATLFNSVAIDAKGNAYVVGKAGGSYHGFGGKISLSGSANEQALIVKYDTEGRALWARTLKESKSAYHGVAVDKEGGIYAAGEFLGIFDLPDTVPSFVNFLGTSEDHGAIIVKYDTPGKAQWVSGFSSDDAWNLTLNAVIVDARGGVYAAGYYQSNSTMIFGDDVALRDVTKNWRAVLVKYDATGHALWASAPSQNPGDSGYYSLAVDEQGSLYVAGQVDGTSAYEFGDRIQVSGSSELINPLLVKYTPDGRPLWARSLEGGYGAFIDTKLACGRGKVYMIGNAQARDRASHLDFGQGVGFDVLKDWAPNYLLAYDYDGKALAVTAPDVLRLVDLKLCGDGRLAIGGQRYSRQFELGTDLSMDAVKVNTNNPSLFLGEFLDSSMSDGSAGLNPQATTDAAVARTPDLKPMAICIDTRVRMRSAPDLKAADLGFLDKDDRLRVLDRSSQKMQIEGSNDYWYRVRRLIDGLEGWSYGRYLKLGDSSELLRLEASEMPRLVDCAN